MHLLPKQSGEEGGEFIISLGIDDWIMYDEFTPPGWSWS
jgi:hypothetical protein